LTVGIPYRVSAEASLNQRVTSRSGLAPNTCSCASSIAAQFLAPISWLSRSHAVCRDGPAGARLIDDHRLLTPYPA